MTGQKRLVGVNQERGDGVQLLYGPLYKKPLFQSPPSSFPSPQFPFPEWFPFSDWKMARHKKLLIKGLNMTANFLSFFVTIFVHHHKENMFLATASNFLQKERNGSNFLTIATL